MNKDDLEFNLLLDAMDVRYGYNFRDYAPDSLRRRIRAIMSRHQIPHISSLIPRILHDHVFFDRFLNSLTITFTEMFRDPTFFANLRQRVLPALSQESHITVWHAGCATGEEVYSLAIVLTECGLYDKCRIYATDVSQDALERAREGIYRRDLLDQYSQQYLQAGGTRQFSAYYTPKQKTIRMDPRLRARVAFAQHDLVRDGPFSDAHLILCRNVLIYFKPKLQNKVLTGFAQSLHPSAFLGLGNKETLFSTDVLKYFKAIAETVSIYQFSSAKPSPELPQMRPVRSLQSA